MLRGNVDTRLGKLEAGEFDAILLAAAGLRRLGLQDHITELLDPVDAPPAPGQGALAIETRAAEADADWLVALRHAPTALTVAAERGALEALEGSCRTAIGAHARIEQDLLLLTVEALTPDGKNRFRRDASLPLGGLTGHAEAHALGARLGRDIRAAAGDRIVWA